MASGAFVLSLETTFTSPLLSMKTSHPEAAGAFSFAAYAEILFTVDNSGGMTIKKPVISDVIKSKDRSLLINLLIVIPLITL